jgi:hypothetical protein
MALSKMVASMRDAASSKRWHGRGSYKVGSYFKGCQHCGEVEYVETSPGREVKRYLTGHNVLRAYCPRAMGYTYYCLDCSAKDHACWEGEWEAGKDAVVGRRGIRTGDMQPYSREDVAACADVRNRVKEQRRQSVRNDAPALSEKAAEIEALEARIRQLMELVKQRGGN